MCDTSIPSLLRRPVGLFVAIILSLACLPATASAAEPLWSVKQFNQLRPRWQELTGTRLRVEGRYSSISSGLLRFENCSMPFRMEESLRPLGDSRTVEVTGKIEQDGSNLFFRVEKLKSLPTDEEEFRRRLAAIGPGENDERYALGDWAADRAKFYDDETLAQLAQAVREDAIAAEYRDWNRKDVAILERLAKKAESLGLSQQRVDELRFEAMHLKWTQARDNARPEAELAALQEDVESNFAGADTAPEQLDRELQSAFVRDAVGTYREAGDETRRSLHRMLRSEIALHRILRNASPDGSNGQEIAEQIETEIPERPDLAKSFQMRHLKYRLSKIDKADRKEAAALAAEFTRLGQRETGEQALGEWLSGREEEARRGGAVGLSRLAEDYITLADDRETAVRLLVEAYGINPANQAISERLQTLGYMLDDGAWVAAEDVTRRPVDPLEAAVREGRIIPGMTDAQVRRALGEPTTKSRAFLSDRISTVWTYGAIGTSRLMVQFETSKPSAPPRVERVSKIAPLARPQDTD